MKCSGGCLGEAEGLLLDKLRQKFLKVPLDKNPAIGYITEKKIRRL